MMQSVMILAAVLASLIASVSLAAPQKPEKPAPDKAKVEASGKKIKEQKKNGKDGREFTVMFDIAGRAQKRKGKKEGKK